MSMKSKISTARSIVESWCKYDTNPSLDMLTLRQLLREAESMVEAKLLSNRMHVRGFRAKKKSEIK